MYVIYMAHVLHMYVDRMEHISSNRVVTYMSFTHGAHILKVSRVETTSVLSKPGLVNLRCGNICAEWTKFKQKFGIYLVAAQMTDAQTEVKWALLMAEAGDDALEIYNAFKDKSYVHICMTCHLS